MTPNKAGVVCGEDYSRAAADAAINRRLPRRTVADISLEVPSAPEAEIRHVENHAQFSSTVVQCRIGRV